MLNFKMLRTSVHTTDSNFDDGSPPLIAQFVLDGFEAVAVYDRNGLSVLKSAGNGVLDDEYRLPQSETHLLAILGCAALRERMTSADLKRLGFRPVVLS